MIIKLAIGIIVLVICILFGFACFLAGKSDKIMRDYWDKIKGE